MMTKGITLPRVSSEKPPNFSAARGQGPEVLPKVEDPAKVSRLLFEPTGERTKPPYTITTFEIEFLFFAYCL